MNRTSLLFVTSLVGSILGASTLASGCNFLDCPEPEVIDVEEGVFRLSDRGDEDELDIDEATITIAADEVQIDYERDGRAYRVSYEVRE